MLLNLRDAIEQLEKNLAKYQKSRGNIDSEERDVTLCRNVRSAFTYFTDATVWRLPDESGEIKEAGEKLKTLFECALSLMGRSRYPDAQQYRASVQKKLEMVEGIQLGGSITDLFKAQESSPKTFKALLSQLKAEQRQHTR